MTSSRAAPLIALIALGGCASVSEGLRGTPQLSPVGSVEPLTTPAPTGLPMPPVQETHYAPNSLWRAGARTFFNDQRAARIGDLLTVKIQIDDSAQVTNSTDRSRSSSASTGVTNFLGLEKALGRALPTGAVDTANLINGQGDTSMKGDGAVNRQEKIELTMAAMVTQVLPNGNLAIAGRQEVRVNNELRELTVAGIIRPEDIAADNTIRNSQIAEARISYGGRGTISAMQKPGWGQRIGDAIAPF
jgi:flagellar L-ring protein precursor FlgH